MVNCVGSFLFLAVSSSPIIFAFISSPPTTTMSSSSSSSNQVTIMSSSAKPLSYSKRCPRTGNPLPNLPIPDPLLSLTPGTWAYDTMSRRLNEEILQRTYEENEEVFNSPPFAMALQRFNELRSELDNASTTKLRNLKFDKDTDGRDTEVVELEEREWKEIMKPFIDKGDTWLSAPWLVTEF